MNKGNVKIISLKKLTEIEILDENGKNIRLVGLLIKKDQFKTDVFFPLGDFKETGKEIVENSYIG